MILDFLSRKKAAEFLGISVRTLDRKVRGKILRSHRRGRKIFFLRKDLESFAKIPEPQPSVFSQFPTEKNDEIPKVFSEFLEKLRQDLKEKDSKIIQLNFELGKWQQIAKNSIPLLEVKNIQKNEQEKIKILQKKLKKTEISKFFFVAIAGIAILFLGIILSVFR